MFITEMAKKILALKECGCFKTNSQFWKMFADKETVSNMFEKDKQVREKAETLDIELNKDYGDDCGVVCIFDEDFPCINPKARDSEKPYLLFYKGDIKLLSNLNNNVAVIGLTDITENIGKREEKIIEALIQKGLAIVSGLAKGCDEVAHRTCIREKAKTIAVLPTTINNIAPASNKELAEKIVESNGLIITEYYKEALSRQEVLARYIERDRLQALFSKAVIMVASYRQGEGDSGSRHAMSYAEKYSVKRYVMFNKDEDGKDKRFGLNAEMASKGVPLFLAKSVDEVVQEVNVDLIKKAELKIKQMSLL
ncbi:MAG: DNA-processing protein DprA [Clostridia bacterium]|nr:DNA-processing protein DprA [Clostridia bacterium]